MKEITPKFIKEILETPFWLETLKTMETYSIQTDDSMGREDIGWFNFTISIDGDVWVNIDGSDLDGKHGCRFCMPIQGGGVAPRVRNALLILAEAIRLDMEDKKRNSS